MFTRKQALAELVKYDEEIGGDTMDDAWRTVQKWIADMVRYEPTIMRRVSRATFGDLGSWVESGADNIQDACGCLVGTTAIEMVKARNHYQLDGQGFILPSADAERYDPHDVFDAYEVVGALCQRKADPKVVDGLKQAAEGAGLAAVDLKSALGQEDAVALIKSEIRLQLAKRAKRVAAAKKAARTRKRKAA